MRQQWGKFIKMKEKNIYFRFRLAWEPEIIGVNNGITQVELDPLDVTTNNLTDFSVNYWKTQKFDPDFPIKPIAKMLKKAKFTDFIRFSPFVMDFHFMISDRLEKIFTKMNMQPYNLYPVKLCASNGDLVVDRNYSLFQCKFLDFGVVDFEKSLFIRTVVTRPGDPHKWNEVSINSEEEYKKAPVLTEIGKLVLNENFDSTLDFVYLRAGDMYVSKKLKEKIEALNITGCEFFTFPELIY